MKSRIFIIIVFYAIVLPAHSQNSERALGDLQPVELMNKLDELNRQIAKTPRDTALYIERGQVNFFLGNYLEALNEFTDIILWAPSMNLYLARALTFIEMRAYQAALDDIEMAIRYDSSIGYLFMQRGRIYHSMAMYNEAIDEYTKAIEMGSVEHYYYGNRALSYFSLKKYQEAADDFTRAIDINPGNWHYFHERGRSYHFLGRSDEAITDFTRSLTITPRSDLHLVYGSRGLVYLGTGRYQNGLSDLERAIECKPDEASLYLTRARIFEILANDANRRVRTELQRLARADYDTYERLNRQQATN